jgi:hypothetical protein
MGPTGEWCSQDISFVLIVITGRQTGVRCVPMHQVNLSGISANQPIQILRSRLHLWVHGALQRVYNTNWWPGVPSKLQMTSLRTIWSCQTVRILCPLSDSSYVCSSSSSDLLDLSNYNNNNNKLNFYGLHIYPCTDIAGNAVRLSPLWVVATTAITVVPEYVVVMVAWI